MQHEQGLLPIRLYNATASDTAPLRYPAGVANGLMPQTRRALFTFTTNQCQAAAAALGLPPFPVNILVDERRQQIAQHLGIAY